MSNRYFCACTDYGVDDGTVVCWRCEQPIIVVDDDKDALTANLLSLGVIYRRRLEKIADAVGRSRMHLVAGSGHTVHFDKDDWFDVQATKDTLDAPLRGGDMSLVICKCCGWAEATSDGYCLNCTPAVADLGLEAEEPETFEDTIGCDMCGAHIDDPCDCFDPQTERRYRPGTTNASPGSPTRR